MQDRNADRSTNSLATHGRTIHMGQFCPSTAPPPIAGLAWVADPPPVTPACTQPVPRGRSGCLTAPTAESASRQPAMPRPPLPTLAFHRASRRKIDDDLDVVGPGLERLVPALERHVPRDQARQ